ncbi:unnamed protein product [Albugo candida]|uniref:Uncharacterized protein n=1 Tax=Albugo candida TaxID=65357 RepID=A0A024FU83_9STRA|nr:unnamed protein product [Albugo candida]|eukprot:CCI10581.1 unnamed protein product [Albugo candida]
MVVTSNKPEQFDQIRNTTPKTNKNSDIFQFDQYKRSHCYTWNHFKITVRFNCTCHFDINDPHHSIKSCTTLNMVYKVIGIIIDLFKLDSQQGKQIFLMNRHSP